VFPVSLLLVGMIYTSTKALQFLSVPVYTIFKNLTIIVIAYGEVMWFGGSVTPSALFSFGLMVLSSVVAAWADIQHALANYGGTAIKQAPAAAAALSTLNAGYAWMGLNVFCSAAYVLGMRKVIKKMNFKDWDSESWPSSVLKTSLTPFKPCSITTSLLFQFSLFALWSLRTGHL
jgi:GDP-mannose transporter